MPSDSTKPNKTENIPSAFERNQPIYKLTIVILSLLLIIAIGISGYLAYQNISLRKQVSQQSSTKFSTALTTKSHGTSTSPTNIPTTVMDTELTIPTEWKTFTSELGFSFEYPTEWGVVTEEIINNDEQQNGYTGKSYSLKFSNITDDKSFYTYAGAIGHSEDYSAPRGANYKDYKGNPNTPPQVNANLLMVSYPCPSLDLPYHGVIDFNLPDKDITGVRLIVPGISENDRSKFSKMLDIDFSKTDTCNDDVINTKARELFLLMFNERKFDNETLKNLGIYERIQESSSISS